jgi:lysophospholipase L1-like esterase
VKEISSAADWVNRNHDSATTVIVQAGTNDLKEQQLESLKKNYVQLRRQPVGHREAGGHLRTHPLFPFW